MALLPRDWLEHSLTELACLAPTQELHAPLLERQGVRLFVKREDLVHPTLGGNKLYKLYGYFRDYRERQCDLPILSFGGAYSNHIAALAAAGASLDIPTIGVIRGEETHPLNETLQKAKHLGMRLHFVTRGDYRRRSEPSFLEELKHTLGDFYHIAEGGAGPIGSRGCESLAEGITLTADVKPDFVCHACGTGSSLAGLTAGFSRQPVGDIYTLGVSILKGHNALNSEVKNQLSLLGVESESWRVLEQYHGGGYAKLSPQLASFMQDFERETGILLDPVYTAKLFWGVIDQLSQGTFPSGSHVLLVHSGGLQGRKGFGMAYDDEEMISV